MRVMVFGMSTKETDAESLPIDMKAKAAEFEAMGKFIEELTAAGVFVMPARDSSPPGSGSGSCWTGPSALVTDGPFTETKELVAGYMLWEVKSMDEALEPG